MNFFPETFDLASFALGFVVGPVAYFAFGIAVYGIYRAGQLLAAPFQREKRLGAGPKRCRA